MSPSLDTHMPPCPCAPTQHLIHHTTPPPMGPCPNATPISSSPPR